MTKKQKLIMEKYKEEFKKLEAMSDNEICHRSADSLLLDAITELGFKELADAWDDVSCEVGFWYS